MQVLCADVAKQEVAASGCRTRFESASEAVRQELNLSSKDRPVVRFRCPVCDVVLRDDFDRLFG